MEVVKVVAALNNGTEEQKKFLLRETKYALLGAALLILFSIPWSGDLIRNVFPMAKGPIIVVYKALLFVAIYYVIQKTEWFQNF